MSIAENIESRRQYIIIRTFSLKKKTTMPKFCLGHIHLTDVEEREKHARLVS